ncbi:WXG100 family type VII secretion target [Streptomyces sp. NPDC002795]|uniref:WXG100 family type VII secretion target n=1 Tax=Streptomyces sp. NPDC002795 TaxID=3364665 RepID=UPI0036C7CA71
MASAPTGGRGEGASGRGFDTPFNTKDLDSLKAMVANTNPGLLREVSQAWKEVHDELVGPDGDGGLLEQFNKAVKKVLESWKGGSAGKFAEEAGKISQEISKGGNSAKVTSDAMFDSADRLDQAKTAIEDMDVSWWDEACDSVGDYFNTMSAADVAQVLAAPSTFGASAAVSQWQHMKAAEAAQGSIDADIASGMDTKQVISTWSDSMGAKREASLQAAIHLEGLAASYTSTSKQLDSDVGTDTSFKPHTPDTGGGPGNVDVPGSGGANPNIPGGAGIGGGGGVGQGIPGFDANGLKPPTAPGGGIPDASQIGTGLDSAGPGLGGGAGSGIGAGGGLGAGGGVGGGAGVGAGGGIGGGMAGGLAGGMAGGAAGLARGAGGGAAGRGAAGRGMSGGGAGAGRGTGAAGRGMGGMGGGMGAGGGAAGKGLAGKTGAGARLKGGAVGGAAGKTGGAFTPGGTGLRNRGTGAGGTGGTGQNGRGGFGPAGAAGGRGAGRQRGEGGNSSRLPDYLTEDKETWTPKDRKANPPVIE